VILDDEGAKFDNFSVIFPVHGNFAADPDALKCW
jgi:hypothetical protein